MQFQPYLTELGLARLLLFETLCLPTILRQSSQDFIWMIRIDPDLNDVVRKKLLALVAPYSHIYILGSNTNPVDFRMQTHLDDIQNHRLWSGDYHFLLRVHNAAQTRLVLESRLDADDGVYSDLFRQLKWMAAKYVNHPNQTIWKLWCPDEYMDWQLVSPWTDLDPGAGVLLRVHPELCATPGLTVLYGLHAKLSDLPYGGHQVFHKEVPRCGPDNEFVNCRVRFLKRKVSAISARTVTSTGMLKVTLEDYEQDGNVIQNVSYRQLIQHVRWMQMSASLGITEVMARRVRQQLRQKEGSHCIRKSEGTMLPSIHLQKFEPRDTTTSGQRKRRVLATEQNRHDNSK